MFCLSKNDKTRTPILVTKNSNKLPFSLPKSLTRSLDSNYKTYKLHGSNGFNISAYLLKDFNILSITVKKASKCFQASSAIWLSWVEILTASFIQHRLPSGVDWCMHLVITAMAAFVYSLYGFSVTEGLSLIVCKFHYVIEVDMHIFLIEKQLY